MVWCHPYPGWSYAHEPLAPYGTDRYDTGSVTAHLPHGYDGCPDDRYHLQYRSPLPDAYCSWWKQWYLPWWYASESVRWYFCGSLLSALPHHLRIQPECSLIPGNKHARSLRHSPGQSLHKPPDLPLSWKGLSRCAQRPGSIQMAHLRSGSSLPVLCLLQHLPLPGSLLSQRLLHPQPEYVQWYGSSEPASY